MASRRPATSALRVRLGVGLLAGVAVLLMATWVVLFQRLLEADRVIAARVREDAMWAVFQADRHAASLLHVVQEALVRRTESLHDEVILAYDVLYSRAQLLERGAFAIDLSAQTTLGQMSAARTGEVLALAPDLDVLDPASPAYLSDLALIAPRISALRDGMAALLLATNQEISLARTTERQSREAIHDRLGWSAALLVLAFLGIGGLLAFQLRQLRRAHLRMGLLQSRSRHQARRARAANATKSTFLATMSHEIRTPLNAIIGSAELLGSAGLDGGQRQRVQTIQSAGQLLLDVINDILDYSKLDTKGLSLQPEPVDLQSVAQTIGSTFADRAAAKNLQLSIDVDACRICTDPGRLRQVIVNLVGNALKFTHAGEVRVTGGLNAANCLRIEVSDTGIGIGPEDQLRLFRDFEQIDGSYARAHGGSGLGLAICKRIVQGMGGQIGMFGTLETGSTFWFEIPVDLLDHTGVEEPLVGLGTPARDGPVALRILIAEDNPINRAVITDQLLHLGHVPTTVDSGFAALETLAEGQFDLVLMDMQMPGISGPDTTRRLRSGGCTLPIIGVTANATLEDRRTCEASGMNGFLPKPVSLDRLSAAIAEVMEGARQEPAIASAPAMPNPQLDDLMTALGAGRVLDLLAQFEESLSDTETDLRLALALQNSKGLDGALHTLKGAALTLGLPQTGQQAQALRQPGRLTPQTLDALLQLARRDITQLRQSIAENAPRAA